MKIKLKEIIWEEKEDIIEGKFKSYDSRFKEPKIEIIKQKDKYILVYQKKKPLLPLMKN